MTGNADPSEQRRSMEQGADDFLAKPFHAKTLLTAIDTRLRRGAMLRAEAEQTRRRLQAIVEATPNMILMGDVLTGKILYLNRAAREMLQIGPREDVTGLGLAEIYLPPHAARLASEVIPGAIAKGSWSDETVFRARGNGEVPVAQVVLAHKDADGQVEFISIIGHDLRSRKQAQRERDYMEVQLRQAQKLESIGQLAAGIAHEINTPTQFIGDNLHFLQDASRDLFGLLVQCQKLLEAARRQSFAPELTEQIDKAIQTIDLADLAKEVPLSITQAQSGVQRVTKIVQAMKDFSHPGIEAKTPIDLNRAIESTLTVCRNEWKYVAVLQVDFDANLPLVSCLPGELNQVILNIVVNAAHAIADKEHGQGMGVIGVRTSRTGDMAEIRVSDTGTGIPDSARGRIFEPFFTTKEVGRGTGQGLAISRSVVVDKHQGEIFFETEIGKGTTFVIRLPLVEGKANASPTRK
jgi:PAS domain S-box-containing protein